MRRSLLFAALAFGASTLMAAEPASTSADQPPANQPKAGPPPAAQDVPEGMLFRSMGGGIITRKTGITMDFSMQTGLSTNSTVQKGAALPGNANGPVASPPDTSFSLEKWEQFIHRDIKANLLFRTTPTAAPMNKHFDWGFMSDAQYGRQANGCRTAGFEHEWSVNQVAPTADSANRYYYACISNAYVQLYAPFWKGLIITAGHFADATMADEIPPTLRTGPNFFYSHNYQYFRVGLMTGLMFSANLLHSKQYGYMMGEFAVHNGQQTIYSMSGKHNYSYALRYRTPKMDTWIDYGGRFGYGSVRTNASGTPLPKAVWVADNLANFHVFSPNPQKMFENSLQLQHQFNNRWKVGTFFQFGKQFGDGASSTIATFSPSGLGACHLFGTGLAATGEPYCQAGFKGASYNSENLFVK